MSDNRLKVLKMLSTTNQSGWKVGKSSELINAVSAKINTLPPDVFTKFSINSNGSKKISIVDFALMTYEMSAADRTALMGLYKIDSNTIRNILSTADEIAEILAQHDIAQSEVTHSHSHKHDKSDPFDEI